MKKIKTVLFGLGTVNLGLLRILKAKSNQITNTHGLSFIVVGVADSSGVAVNANGFEYEIAEIGSGTGRSRGNVAIELKDSYAQFAHLHLNNHGVIRHRTAA